MTRLNTIFHPRWSSWEDHELLLLKKSGHNFSGIAMHLNRPRVAVEQRWHRLRVVPDIVKQLEAFGLSHAPYPQEGDC